MLGLLQQLALIPAPSKWNVLLPAFYDYLANQKITCEEIIMVKPQK
jgi:hypothetical protein